jgi:hypothetical protein
VRVADRIAAVYARPPLSWLVVGFDLLAAPVNAVVGWLRRWNARHRARELDDLAEALERAGMPAQAVLVSGCADRLRSRP